MKKSKISPLAAYNLEFKIPSRERLLGYFEGHNDMLRSASTILGMGKGKLPNYEKWSREDLFNTYKKLKSNKLEV